MTCGDRRLRARVSGFRETLNAERLTRNAEVWTAATWALGVKRWALSVPGLRLILLLLLLLLLLQPLAGRADEAFDAAMRRGREQLSRGRKVWDTRDARGAALEALKPADDAVEPDVDLALEVEVDADTTGKTPPEPFV